MSFSGNAVGNFFNAKTPGREAAKEKMGSNYLFFFAVLASWRSMSFSGNALGSFFNAKTPGRKDAKEFNFAFQGWSMRCVLA